MRVSNKIRKQGRCVCDECKRSWSYDYKEKRDLETLNLGHTEGFTHYLHCFEHKKEERERL